MIELRDMKRFEGTIYVPSHIIVMEEFTWLISKKSH